MTEAARCHAGPQFHVRPVECLVAGAELAEQCGAGPDDRGLVQGRYGNDRAAVHHDADHALGHPPDVPEVRSGDRTQGEPAADMKTQVLRGDLVDHHLAWLVWLRLAPGEQLRDLQQMAESAVQRRADHCLLVQLPARSDGLCL